MSILSHSFPFFYRSVAGWYRSLSLTAEDWSADDGEATA
jgi:hypothetical protein